MLSSAILSLLAAMTLTGQSPQQQRSTTESKTAVAAPSKSKDLLSEAKPDGKWDWVAARLETTRDEARLSFPDETLPESFILEVAFGSFRDHRAAFSLRLSAERKESLLIETWDDTIVMMFNETFVELRRLNRGDSVAFLLGVDRKNKTVSVFSADGKRLGRIKGYEIASPTLSLVNLGPQLSVETLRIQEWDGTDPSARPSLGEYLRNNGLIYTGPNRGRNWITRQNDGELPCWSTNPKGGLVCGSPYSSVFLPIKDMPESLELELVIDCRRSPGVRRWEIALSDPAPRMRPGRLRFSVAPNGDSQQLIVRSSDSRVFGEFPEGDSESFRLRVFYKKIDSKKTEVTVCSADGREVAQTIVSSSAPKNGIALWGQTGMTFSHVNVRRWDGKRLARRANNE